MSKSKNKFLILVKGRLGLADPESDVLLGCDGSLQLGLQSKPFQRRHNAAGHRLDRRSDLLHRHHLQLPHVVRRERRSRHR